MAQERSRAIAVAVSTVFFRGSQVAFPSQFNLSCHLPFLVASFGRTYGKAVAYFNFVFDIRESARAVAWLVDAAQGLFAKVLATVRYSKEAQSAHVTEIALDLVKKLAHLGRMSDDTRPSRYQYL